MVKAFDFVTQGFLFVGEVTFTNIFYINQGFSSFDCLTYHKPTHISNINYLNTSVRFEVFILVFVFLHFALNRFPGKTGPYTFINTCSLTLIQENIFCVCLAACSVNLLYPNYLVTVPRVVVFSSVCSLSTKLTTTYKYLALE